MITLFQTTEIYTAQDARRRLAEQIRQLPYRITPVGAPLSVLRFEFFIEPIDILAWLHNQKVQRKIYWSDRRGVVEAGGIGVADSIEGKGHGRHQEAFEHMETRLSADNVNLRYYGGMAFQMNGHRDDWRDFEEYQFIIPRFEIVKNEGGCQFAFNIAVKNIAEESLKGVLVELETIDFSAATTYRTPPQVQTRQDFPDQEGWNSMFRAITDETGKMICEKIVLARRSVFRFDKYIDPVALIKHLKDRSPNCFHFCFQTGSTRAFLGATPERLYLREKDSIKTEALAGTTPRGKNDDEDASLEKGLFSCAKNTREHRFVADDIKKQMEGLCDSVRCDENTGLVKLRVGQHLVTGFEGILKKGKGDAEIITALHPTPAVGGCPREAALEAITRLEPFDRGWYAGPVGYVGHEKTEFAVGIRSALVNHDRLSLYSGAGIVEGSNAKEEWDEIEMKIGNFIDVFKVTGNQREITAAA